MFRLIVSGKTVAQLREQMTEFLNETSVESTGIEEVRAIAKEETRPLAKLPPVPSPVPVMFPTANHVAPSPAWVVAAATDQSPKPPAVPVGNILEFGVDSNGIPWDPRIHAVTQGVNKDGSWRTRRGVENSEIKRIEAELLNAVKAQRGGTTAPAAMIPPIPQVAPPPPPFIAPPLVFVPPVHTPPPAPVVSASPVSIAPPNLSAHNLETFKTNLVATLAKLVQDGKLTQDYVQSLKDYFQVDQIWNCTDAQLSEMFDQFVNAGLLVRV